MNLQKLTNFVNRTQTSQSNLFRPGDSRINRSGFDGLLRQLKPIHWLPLILAGLISVGLGFGYHQAGSAGEVLTSEKIGPGVVEALAASGKAEIIIALNPPTTFHAPSPDIPTIIQDTTQLQDQVLSTLSAIDYQGRIRFRAVPGLAGTIYTTSGLEKLASNPAVMRIDLDSGGQAVLDVSVPLIGANEWHAAGVTGEGVVVAILDSGMDTDHGDLGDDLIHEECFGDNDLSINGIGFCPNGSDRQSGPGAAEDDNGHGTNVTGIVTSNGSVSFPGVAPDAEIVAIKVINATGGFSYFSELVAAWDYILVDRPDVQIISMSLGTYGLWSGDCDASFATGAMVLNLLRANGVIAFAATANNSSGTSISSPACISSVIAVGATNDIDDVATFSNSNASTDIMAPGVGITSSGLGNVVSTYTGTSQATPHAAGCAALFIQAGVAVTPDEIEARLETSPIQVTDSKNGLTFPRIDCRPIPPPGVEISGPPTGTVEISYPFTANTIPFTATVPMTYTWQATGQLPVIHTGGLSDGVDFAWSSPGLQAITVTVQNNLGMFTDTHTIEIEDVPEVLDVEIDIKPGSENNVIPCKANELIPVAILTTDSFNALDVNHLTVSFEGATEIHLDPDRMPVRHERDMDGDGDIDLLFHFKLGDTDLTCDSTSGVLVGKTLDSQRIQATDSILLVREKH